MFQSESCAGRFPHSVGSWCIGKMVQELCIVAVSFASCGNKAADAAKATADSIRIADSIAAVEAAALEAEQAAAAAADSLNADLWAAGSGRPHTGTSTESPGTSGHPPRRLWFPHPEWGYHAPICTMPHCRRGLPPSWGSCRGSGTGGLHSIAFFAGSAIGYWLVSAGFLSPVPLRYHLRINGR